MSPTRYGGVLIQWDWSPYKKKEMWIQRQREEVPYDGTDVQRRMPVRVEAETGVMHLQAKDFWPQPEVQKRPGMILRSLHGA